MSEQPAQPIEIRTPRLLLRPPTLEDADAYFEIARDPEYAVFGSRDAANRESTRRALERIVAIPWGQRAEFAVELHGQVVGRVTLDIDRQNRTVALGYGIGRTWWGLGLATEAAQAAVNYAFRALGADKVWARADPRNVASVRVLEKMGMQREGLLRSQLLYRGERVDRVYYGVLREEWQTSR